MSIKNIKNGKNFKAINVGALNEVKNFTDGKLKGKIFLKDLIDTTSCEISITSIPSHTELPFFHSHQQNEEVYIIIKGSGKFQVDDDVFSINEGSIIRVSTPGKRSMSNTSNDDMIYIVFQAKENSLTQWVMGDGIINNDIKSKM